MKAIETRYNGHRFRSRTEARWAVLLDHLGVKYEYEPEGYEVGEGQRYLPDFWLPKEQCYLEVKGDAIADHEWRKIALLVHGTGHAAYVLTGQPGNHTVALLRPHYFAPVKDRQAITQWLAQAPDGMSLGFEKYFYAADRPPYTTDLVYFTGLALSRGFVDIDYSARHKRLAHWQVDLVQDGWDVVRDEQTGAWTYYMTTHKYVSFEAIGLNERDVEDRDCVKRTKEFLAAIDAARSARFEFGESGAG